MTDEKNEKTTGAPAFAEDINKPTEEKLASAGKKVEDLKKAIEELGYKVEQEGEEIKISE
jgi:anti-sigma28 factor (negative regulator of flagellin synthesis)